MNSTREPETRNLVKIFSEVRDFDRIRVFFGRTDLRISLSRAKFDVEADFDVRSAVDRPKPRQISEKRKFDPKISPKKNFRREKTKRSESSETRFGKVSRRSEPCWRSYDFFFTSIGRRELIPQPHMPLISREAVSSKRR